MKNLKELTQNRIYRIPDYQRGYSWEKKQIHELIDDIENIRIQNDQSYHFTGILSYSKIDPEKFSEIEGIHIPEDDEFEIYHITDGQQRMTTLYIMLFEIYKLIHPLDYQEKFIRSVLTVDFNGKKIYKFGYDIDVPSREHLYNTIFEDDDYPITNPDTLYTNNLDNAKTILKEHFLSLDQVGLKNFKRKLEQRLLFQEFVIDTKKLDVSMVFETMNYRGKSLSKLELFKNRLIYLLCNKFHDKNEVDQLRKKITDTWLIVYSWLGKKSDIKLSDDGFLTAFTIMHFNNDDTRDSEFKNIIDRLFVSEFPIKSNGLNNNLTVDKINDLANSMQLAAKCYFLIHNPFTEDQEIKDLKLPHKIKKELFVINHVGGANYIKTLLCCAIARYLNSTERKDLELLDLLYEIEKHQMLVFNLLGRKIDANRPYIYQMCHSLYTGHFSYSDAFQEVQKLTFKWWDKKNFIDLIQDNLNKSINRFYGVNGIKMLIYLKEVDIDIIPDQILKISDYRLGLVFPESYGSNVKFPNVVRSRDPKSIDYLRFSLGNIIITERSLVDRANVTSNNYFEQRIQNLEKSNISENKTIVKKINSWSDIDILNRGTEIFNFIKDRYNLTKLTEDNIRRILVDNLVIQRSVE